VLLLHSPAERKVFNRPSSGWELPLAFGESRWVTPPRIYASQLSYGRELGNRIHRASFEWLLFIFGIVLQDMYLSALIFSVD
jgi:hypothetical protein